MVCLVLLMIVYHFVTLYRTRAVEGFRHAHSEAVVAGA
jgi:hypothetical protein